MQAPAPQPLPPERRAWLWLVESSGHRPAAQRALLRRFGGPEQVQALPEAQRHAFVGAPARPAEAPEAWARRLAAVEAWQAGAPQRHLLALGDADYPEALLSLPDPPLWLYAEGLLDRLAAPALAVVGSRNPTPAGADHARAFARDLAARGLLIVSGLARGIDAAAHEGALAAAGGAGTLAVIGTGIDRLYPASHAALARRIVADGLLLSEYPLGTPPLAANFPRRNRLIAGLGQGTLVIEAALASGSLITARLAAEAGREVLAIPGSIDSPQSRGCHSLIKQGAQLVETVDDVLDALGGVLAGRLADAAPRVVAVEGPVAEPGEATGASGAEPTAQPTAEGDETDPLLRALGHDPVDLDTLVARTGLDAASLNVQLLALELDGRLARLGGGRVQRRGRA
ncbi:DNA-protecting protein DprA [Piscinibacter sp. Jin2]|uniref:DNA-protecting protein DprA n=1 Tax=Aquariibacter lacus TaxID=2801332 RepID=A0A9X0XAN0_9BURK|nr:DNA-processing protein DprA [Piscinibacter lacus]MBL0718347.1 DNA-protecting protein DprA [Piscinibacter lacus]